MLKRRIVAYLRVSTAEQAEEGYSISGQENVIRQKCEAEGKELVAVYADKGISGKSMTNRLQLQQMLQDAKAGNCRAIQGGPDDILGDVSRLVWLLSMEGIQKTGTK